MNENERIGTYCEKCGGPFCICEETEEIKRQALIEMKDDFKRQANIWRGKAEEVKESSRHRYYQGKAMAYKYTYNACMELLYGKDWRKTQEG